MNYSGVMALDFAKKKRFVVCGVSAPEFPCFGFVTSLSNAYIICVFFRVFQNEPSEHRRQARRKD